MKNKSFIALAMTAAMLTLSACQNATSPSVLSVNNASLSTNKVNSITISGKAEFPGKFNVKNHIPSTTLAQVADRATVSLIYPSDYSDPALRNVTISTALTKVDGSFDFSVDPNFQPLPNQAYKLEATKRVAEIAPTSVGPGNPKKDLVSVRTLIKFTPTGVRSITGNAPNLFINSKTTALALIQELSPTLISTDEILDKVTITCAGSPSVCTSTAQDISGPDKIIFQSLRSGSEKIISIDPVAGSTEVDLTAPNNNFTNIGVNTTPSFFSSGSRIAFRSTTNGNDEIYTIRRDGTDQKRLTNNLISDTDPMVNNQNNKIVFVSQRDVNQEIYTMDIDGANQVRLTTDGAADLNPVWSPDGTKIAFQSNRGAANKFDIYVMDAGGNLVNLTAANPNSDETMPMWSATGNKISFLSNRDNNTEIYTIMNTTQTVPPTAFVPSSPSVQTRITNTPGNESGVVWSPSLVNNNNFIAYNLNNNIYKIDTNAANSTPIVLTSSIGTNTDPSWSYDGTKITFRSTRDNNGNDSEIYIMNADGTVPTRLTTNLFLDTLPKYFPKYVKVTAKTIMDTANVVDYAIENAYDPLNYISKDIANNDDQSNFNIVNPVLLP